MAKGVSVVVCCYNSSALLTETLDYLFRQKTDIDWEIIIVNNSSTDDTVETAKKILSNRSTVGYKILDESIPGLSFARRRGILESNYEYIIFCDDDNHLDSDYIDKAFQLMESDDMIGIAGGISEPVFEIKKPFWFDEFCMNFASGKQSESSGEISDINSVLWGTGMILRKSVMMKLFNNGFRSLLSDRKHGKLSSGGDSEFCYVVRILGYKIYYDENLKLKHFISGSKLNWIYLRKLNRAFGAQKVYFDPYIKLLLKINSEISPDNSWFDESRKLIGKIRKSGFKKLLSFKKLNEGDPYILRLEKNLGKLQELLKIRNNYNDNFKKIESSDWIKKII